MLYCYSEEEDIKKRQERCFINAKRKIDNKIVALYMTINDSQVSKAQREKLNQYLKESVL